MIRLCDHLCVHREYFNVHYSTLFDEFSRNQKMKNLVFVNSSCNSRITISISCFVKKNYDGKVGDGTFGPVECIKINRVFLKNIRRTQNISVSIIYYMSQSLSSTYTCQSTPESIPYNVALEHNLISDGKYISIYIF